MTAPEKRAGNYRITDEINALLQCDEMSLQYSINGKVFKKHLKTADGAKIGKMVAASLIAKAFSGDNVAIKEIIDRLEGKAAQPISLDNTVDIRVGFEDDAAADKQPETK